jgi:leader peptidase (prepilin peptidase)/N-methyltransferase
MSTGGASTETVVIAVAALVGLFVGSFLNVVVYRAPLGLSVSAPRSFCPTCDRQLRWWENVPLVSWLALRGRCHSCHEPISIRYPLVEAVTALVFALVAWAWHGSSLTAGYCVLAATAIAVCLIEFGGSRSPLSVGAAGAGLGQVLVVASAVWLGRWAVLGWSLAGLLVASLLFAVLRLRDPDCRDPRTRGRTLLPVAGCWLGGLGGVPTVAGLAALILSAFVCLVVLWSGTRRGQTSAGGSGVRRWIRSVASVPLVTGIAVALAVSLTVAG